VKPVPRDADSASGLAAARQPLNSRNRRIVARRSAVPSIAMATRHHSDEPPARRPDTAAAPGRSRRRGDSRPAALGNIWGSAIAMLVLCIPLAAVSRTANLPLIIIVGTAVVSLYIWWSGSAERKAESSEADELRAKIKELEERLANVEVINRFEDRLAEKRLRLEAEQAVAPPRAEEQA